MHDYLDDRCSKHHWKQDSRVRFEVHDIWRGSRDYNEARSETTLIKRDLFDAFRHKVELMTFEILLRRSLLYWSFSLIWATNLFLFLRSRSVANQRSKRRRRRCLSSCASAISNLFDIILNNRRHDLIDRKCDSKCKFWYKFLLRRSRRSRRDLLFILISFRLNDSQNIETSLIFHRYSHDTCASSVDVENAIHNDASNTFF